MTMWYVYLISTGTRTYVGSTTDPDRRLRQHNGEIRGGARSTSRWKGKWKLIAYISGFSGRGEALRWEKLIKSRARGYEPRMTALWLVSSGVCPQYKNRKQYQPPEGLALHVPWV